MAKSIKKKRNELGLSQAELAKALRMSRPTLIKVEKGERKLSKEESRKFNELIDTFDLEKQQENMRINIPQENKDKFKQVLLYVLEKVGAKPNVGLTVLYKLLYFIDFDYYEKYEKQLMGLTYFKNTHGPTPRSFSKIIKEMKNDGEVEEVKSKYFSRDQKKFLPLKESDISVLNGQEIEMINDVLRRYAEKSASQLSELSHRDMPWKATKGNKDIEYELVFYRSEEFSVRDYEEL